MSGSSRAVRVLSRCVVTMDAGIRISWATNPDGSYPGTEYHAREEDAFQKTIDKNVPAIEALFDEMAQSGWSFTLTSDESFHDKSQHAESHGHTIVELSLLPEPELTEDEFTQLVEKIAHLLGQEKF